jgi:hypothetical protein
LLFRTRESINSDRVRRSRKSAHAIEIWEGRGGWMGRERVRDGVCVRERARARDSERKKEGEGESEREPQRARGCRERVREMIA